MNVRLFRCKLFLKTDIKVFFLIIVNKVVKNNVNVSKNNEIFSNNKDTEEKVCLRLRVMSCVSKPICKQSTKDKQKIDRILFVLAI